MDEPTNHLDVVAVKWLTDYLNSLTSTTICIVSHDYAFLSDVCTDVCHISGKKLSYFSGGFAAFQKACERGGGTGRGARAGMEGGVRATGEAGGERVGRLREWELSRKGSVVGWVHPCEENTVLPICLSLDVPNRPFSGCCVRCLRAWQTNDVSEGKAFARPP